MAKNNLLTTGNKFRRAERKDVRVLGQLIREFAKYLGMEKYLERDTAAHEASLKKWLFGTTPLAEAWFVEEDNKPIAYFITYLTFSTFRARANIYVEDLFVTQRYQNEGVGKAILCKLSEWAHKKGYGKVHLCCPANNKRLNRMALSGCNLRTDS